MLPNDDTGEDLRHKHRILTGTARINVVLLVVYDV